jgi:hypothetical protein
MGVVDVPEAAALAASSVEISSSFGAGPRGRRR